MKRKPKIHFVLNVKNPDVLLCGRPTPKHKPHRTFDETLVTCESCKWIMEKVTFSFVDGFKRVADLW